MVTKVKLYKKKLYFIQEIVVMSVNVKTKQICCYHFSMDISLLLLSSSGQLENVAIVSFLDISVKRWEKIQILQEIAPNYFHLVTLVKLYKNKTSFPS